MRGLPVPPQDLVRPKTMRQPQTAAVPPRASENTVDPPPTYVQLEELVIAHTHERHETEQAADSKPSLGNH
jgi:hypothetical protein